MNIMSQRSLRQVKSSEHTLLTPTYAAYCACKSFKSIFTSLYLSLLYSLSSALSLPEFSPGSSRFPDLTLL